MTKITAHTATVYRWHNVEMCSCGAIFSLIIWLLFIVAPYFLAYSSHGA